ncbi:MAG: hypothetical protein O7A08_07800, partial [SAR324 cluster bacterium]|nr:hypothetical protein [SAR324 cluster bacterium]
NKVTWVNRINNMPNRKAAPIPGMLELNLQDYEIILRRLIVSYGNFGGFTDGDPLPLFTDRQVLVFTRILKMELPKLQADERLEFRFEEVHEGYGVLMEVYGEGEYLIFDFRALARDLVNPPDRTYKPHDRAGIIPQAGQIVEAYEHRTIVREPIRKDVAAIARLLQSKLDQVDKAQREDVLEEKEGDKLRNLIRISDRISVGSLRLFFLKRKTLGLALKQSLLNQEEFDTRLVKLTDELQR